MTVHQILVKKVWSWLTLLALLMETTMATQEMRAYLCSDEKYYRSEWFLKLGTRGSGCLCSIFDSGWRWGGQVRTGGLDRLGTKIRRLSLYVTGSQIIVCDKLENPQLYSGFDSWLLSWQEKVAVLAKKFIKLHVWKGRDYYFIVCDGALETAHYIAVKSKLDLFVEPFFHEWRPGLDGITLIN